MKKNIHIRTSQNSLDVCWIRSSDYRKNIFKIFKNTQCGILDLINWLSIGYQPNMENICVKIESYENSHPLLLKLLLNIQVTATVIQKIQHEQLHNHLQQLSNKMEFMKKLISDYETKLIEAQAGNKIDLSDIALERSIETLKNQLQHSQDKYTKYLQWENLYTKM